MSNFGASYIETLKIEQQNLSRNSNVHNLSLECLIRGHNISWRSKLNIRSSREIWIVITFHNDVRFGDIIYRFAQNWKTEAFENLKWSLLLTRIRGDTISRRSKLNYGSSRQIRMVITFHTDVQFWVIIYRDTRNWTAEAREKIDKSYYFTRISD